MSLLSKAVTHLFFVYSADQLAAWSVTTPQAIRRLALSGEELLKVRSEHSLNEGCKDAVARLRSDGSAADFIHWITATEDVDSLLKSKPLTKDAHWQILSWEWLSQRFATEEGPWQNIALLEGQIFPWLATANKAKERETMQQALHHEHQSKSAQLAQERDQLELENEALRAQNSALQNVDAENLVRFLPALFPRVFTVLGAADLALLCGRVEPLAIPNPYPEPCEETLHVLQKKFRNLPRALQQKVVGLVAQLPQRNKLRPRAEMRALISELEEG